jgi:hypothetical protein
LSSRRVWGADHDLLERFLADSRHQSIFCWIAHWDEDKIEANFLKTFFENNKLGP